MLQSKKISKVLAEGLSAVPNHVLATSTNSPFSISLLSADGIPLTTVNNTSLLNNNSQLGPDNFKIYSLVGYNALHQHEDEEDWTIVEVDASLKLVIEKLALEEDEKLYVVLFYDKGLADSIAKLKLDGVRAALEQGLKGYTKEN